MTTTHDRSRQNGHQEHARSKKTNKPKQQSRTVGMESGGWGGVGSLVRVAGWKRNMKGLKGGNYLAAETERLHWFLAWWSGQPETGPVSAQFDLLIWYRKSGIPPPKKKKKNQNPQVIGVLNPVSHKGLYQGLSLNYSAHAEGLTKI